MAFDIFHPKQESTPARDREFEAELDYLLSDLNPAAPETNRFSPAEAERHHEPGAWKYR